jgi:DNA-binding transcriptional LysR family regulator
VPATQPERTLFKKPLSKEQGPWMLNHLMHPLMGYFQSGAETRSQRITLCLTHRRGGPDDERRELRWNGVEHSLRHYQPVSADSDLLAVVPDYVAKAKSACSVSRAEPAPMEIGSYELSLVWRAVADNVPAERWLRSRFSEFFGDNSRLRLSDPIGDPTDRSSLA